MPEARGIGLGVLLTLLVLAVLIALCGVLLVPHLLARGGARLLGIRRRPRAHVTVAAPPAWRPWRLAGSVDVHDEGTVPDHGPRGAGAHHHQPVA